MPVVLTALDLVVSGEVALSRGARIALLTNLSAQTAGIWSGDALRNRGYDVAVLLTPEHGLRVDAPAGAPVAHGRYADLPIFSLYGAERAAVDEVLPTIDLVVVDLPDVGCRYYTYAWTVVEVLRLAARYGRPVTLLDRPNPLGGQVEGRLPDPGRYSAVCASQVPNRHGLTFGELALWNRDIYGIDVDLQVVPCAGWRRDSLWPELGLPWISPSPALPDFASAALYPGTCLFEGTNLSEGRGTDAPFRSVGAPFVQGGRLADSLASHPFLAGIDVRSADFTPGHGKWAGRRCGGIVLEIADAGRASPVRAGLALVEAAMRWPGFSFAAGHFDALAGSSQVREQLEAGVPATEIAARWEQEEADFERACRRVQIY